MENDRNEMPAAIAWWAVGLIIFGCVAVFIDRTWGGDAYWAFLAGFTYAFLIAPAFDALGIDRIRRIRRARRLAEAEDAVRNQVWRM